MREEDTVHSNPAYRTCSVGDFGRTPQWVSSLGALCVGLFLFGLLALSLRPAYPITAALPATPGVDALEMLGIPLAYGVLLTLPLIALHEYVHGLAFKWAGGNPRYLTATLKQGMRIFYTYTGCAGLRTPCWKYRVILAAPTVLVNVVGLLAMVPPTPIRYYMAIALALHLAGCVGDWWMLAVLRGVPNHELVEDLPDGFRYPQPQ